MNSTCYERLDRISHLNVVPRHQKYDLTIIVYYDIYAVS
jgi:hypothetical protein